MEEAIGPIWAFIVEHVAVAVLLVIAGLIATLVIERTKMDWAFKAELAKMRVAPVSETWAAAAAFEAQANLLIQAALKTMMQGGDVEELRALEPIESESKRLAEVLRRVADKKRFFLGEKDYMAFIRFHNAVMDRIGSVADSDLDGLKKADVDIKRGRKSLGDFVKIPF